MSTAANETLVPESIEPALGLTSTTPDAPEKKKIPGIRKAAMFLAQMSADEAGVVFAKLRPSEVEMLTTEIMRLRSVDPDDAVEVLDEFHQMMQARQIATFLKDEHPQIIALVLSHLQPQQSAEVLARLAPEVQADVALRIATMERAAPETVQIIETELSRRVGSVLAHQDMATVGGVSALVEIINRSDRSAERSIMEWLDTQDAELAERVRSQMFVFEDIVSIDDRSMQVVLQQVQVPDLALALKGVSDTVASKVRSNLSQARQQTLQEEIDLLGPVRSRNVEEAQAKIVQVIRGLEEAGEITISRSGEDELIS